MGNSTSSKYVHPLTLFILEFLDWKERGYAACLNKNYRNYMLTEIVFKWHCTRLSLENGVYCSTPNSTWQNLFKYLYSLRHIWKVHLDHTLYESRFKVNVFTRFRPLDHGVVDEGVEVVLPLHQRLGLIKLSYGIKNRKDALRILKEEGQWFGSKWASIDSTKENMPNKSNNAPHSERLKASVQNIDAGSGRVVMVAHDVGLREFSFDTVFPPTSNQRQIYDVAAKPLVGDLLNGFNATIIMYGQTGSGKTYTMFGPELNPLPSLTSSRETEGIVSRTCKEILFAINHRRNQGIESTLHVSFVEIFGESIIDLLRYGQRCGHSRVAAQQYVLSGAAEQEVHTLDDVLHLLKVGDIQKKKAATAMNERSSRAHSLFIITLRQKKSGTEVTMSSRLFLADLGGSEQVKKSQIESGTSRKVASLETNQEFSAGFELGERMREAVYINLGLLALKKCIEALNNQAPYIPYKDSKLTMLLSEGLGGACRTSVIVCGNMDSQHASETMAALRFGEKCSLIEMEVRNNATILAGVLEKIDREIADLNNLIIKNEQWETVEEHRIDANAEEGTLEAALGGKERRLVTVLKGAEKERKRLGELLIQKEQLIGSLDPNLEESQHDVKAFGGRYAVEYGIGTNFDPVAEEKLEVVRFNQVVDEKLVPVAVKAKGKKWVSGDEIAVSAEELERRARRANRNKSVYSGLS